MVDIEITGVGGGLAIVGASPCARLGDTSIVHDDIGAVAFQNELTVKESATRLIVDILT